VIQDFQKLKLALEKGIERIVLIGLSGIGKSELAKRYVHNYKDKYDKVIWLDAKDRCEFSARLLSPLC
jgi:GTPase SAR1 family protein